MQFFIVLFFFPILAFTQDIFELNEEELNPDTEEILIKKPEKYLRHDSVIYDLNTDLGIKDQRRYTGLDRNKFSLAGHLSSDYEHLTHLLGAEFNYMRRSERYDQMWYGFQLFQHKTNFDSITQNQTPKSGDDSNSDSQFQRPGDAKSNILGFGLGIGYRFKLLLDFFPTEDVFESIHVYANYLILEETYISRNYKGYGLSGHYSLHKRSSTNYFYGGKLTYNVASVTREAIGSEKENQRSFALGWSSIAFEIGFFF